MTEQNNFQTQSIFNVSLTTRMLVGAGIGLILISFFLSAVKNPNPAWGELWMLRPLIIVPLAGAMGGLFFYLANYLRKLYGWNTILINVICFFVFIIGLWMGIVLGLVGTLWH